MSSGAEYGKPLPQPIPTTQPFWQAAKEHRLVVQRCQDCANFIFYPRLLCPHCSSDHLEWVRVSGQGKVYSYTVVRRPTLRGFEQDAPYVFAVVELKEGPRMVANIVDCPVEEVRVDMPVEAIFDDVTPEITLVKFRQVKKA